MSFILRQPGPGVGIWRPPQMWHVAPSTRRLSCGLGFPIYCNRTPDNVHMSLMTWLNPEYHHLPPRQTSPNYYNVAGGTTLLQVPTQQRPLLLRVSPAPLPGIIAFVASCTIGATCACLRLGS